MPPYTYLCLSVHLTVPVSLYKDNINAPQLQKCDWIGKFVYTKKYICIEPFILVLTIEYY